MREIDLYNIGTDPESLQAALIALRQDFDAHDHDGVNSRSFQTIKIETLAGRVISIRKPSYDSAVSGLWVGLLGAIAKLSLGDDSKYLKWDGTTLTISGDIFANNMRFKRWTVLYDLGSLDGWETSVSAGATLAPYASNIMNLSAPDGADRTVYAEVGSFGVKIGASGNPIQLSEQPTLECLAIFTGSGDGSGELRMGGVSVDTNVFMSFTFSGTTVTCRYRDDSATFNVGTAAGIDGSLWHRYRMVVTTNGSNFDLNWYVDDVLKQSALNKTITGNSSKNMGVRVKNNWITGGVADSAILTIASPVFQQG